MFDLNLREECNNQYYLTKHVFSRLLIAYLELMILLIEVANGYYLFDILRECNFVLCVLAEN